MSAEAQKMLSKVGEVDCFAKIQKEFEATLKKVATACEDAGKQVQTACEDAGKQATSACEDAGKQVNRAKADACKSVAGVKKTVTSSVQNVTDSVKKAVSMEDEEEEEEGPVDSLRRKMGMLSNKQKEADRLKEERANDPLRKVKSSIMEAITDTPTKGGQKQGCKMQ